MRLLHALFAATVALCQIVAQDAQLDPTFNPIDPGFGMGDGAKGSVNAVLVLPDGKILIGGDFSFVDGIPYKRIARLNADGSVDQTFLGGVEGGNVDAMVLQPDGRIIIAGGFTSVTSVPAVRIARIFSDGTLDPSFNAGIGAHNGGVLAVALQADGRIVAGGSFDGFGGAFAGRIVRLNTDGSRDLTFTTGIGFDNEVLALEVSTDGKILVGGRFGSFNGATRTGIARLHSDGSVDTGFMNAALPGYGLQSGSWSLSSTFGVYDIAIRPTGEILFCGSFNTVNGMVRPDLAQVDQWTGALTSSFVPSTTCNTTVYGCFFDELLLMPDGAVLVGGYFQSCGEGWYGNEDMKRGLVRFDVTGSKDEDFSPLNPSGASSGSHYVRALARFPDGSVLAGGIGLQMAQGGAGFVKITPTGVQDPTFHHVGGGADGLVRHVCISPDDAIWVGGEMAAFNGLRRHGTARILANGTHDLTCAPAEFHPMSPNIIWYANGGIPVYDMFVQPDGKLVRAVRGNPPFGRLLANGSYDPTYSLEPVGGLLATPRSMAPFPDGRVLALDLSGDLASLTVLGLDGEQVSTPSLSWLRAFSPEGLVLPDDRMVIAARLFENSAGDDLPGQVQRLLADGSLDPAFTPVELTFTPATAKPVNAILVQPDGKLIIAGIFSAVNGVARAGVARLNIDGSLDDSFDPGSGANGPVYCAALRADGRVLLGGAFTAFDGTTSKFLVQLMPDATIDPSYTFGDHFGHYVPGDGAVVALGLQSDGRLVVGGDFTSYMGVGRNRLLRLQAPPPSALAVTPRVFLEGAMASPGVMSDLLRAGGLLPLAEPYTGLGFAAIDGGGESTTQAVLNTPLNSAVVDWIQVQLRSPNDPSELIAVRNGLLLQNGFIVDVDGVSPLTFPGVPPGQYYLAVRHRNHLGVMTATPYQFTSTPAYIDFTQPYTMVYGNEARKYVFPDMLLWAGDVNHDGALLYTGQSNDRDPILVTVGGTTPNNVTTGYKLEDINLDGVVKYTGQDNDRDPILVNVGSTTPNNVRQAQLP